MLDFCTFTQPTFIEANFLTNITLKYDLLVINVKSLPGASQLNANKYAISFLI